MKRVILTGATGFVGANLARRLLQDGHTVHLLLRHEHSNWRIAEIEKDLCIHLIDLNDTEALNNLVPSIQPDWIFHLAAYGAYSWQGDLEQMVSTNIQGTMHLVNACLRTGFEAFINTGSSSEYGFKDHPPSEIDILEPNSYYAVTKASATLFCQYAAQREKANITTLRLYSVYGPYEDPRRLIPTLIREGQQRKLPLLVDPDTARDFVHVEDVNDAYLLAACQPKAIPGQVFNLGSGVQTRLKEVVEVSRKYFHIQEEPQWGSMPSRSWDAPVWVANPQKISNILGWKPALSFEDGFQKTADWYREHNNHLIMR